MTKTNKWIQKAINPQHKGKLRSALHAKAGKDIPLRKLEKAEKSKNPQLRKEAGLALTLRRIRLTKKIK